MRVAAGHAVHFFIDRIELRAYVRVPVIVVRVEAFNEVAFIGFAHQANPGDVEPMIGYRYSALIPDSPQGLFETLVRLDVLAETQRPDVRMLAVRPID